MIRLSLRVAGVLAVAASVAHANNDLNTSFRAGSIALPSVDGRSPADADGVGADQGRVTYRLPIVAPPGKPGVEPDLALAYGGRGDGVVGAGWALEVPSIRVKTSGRGGQPAWGVDETYLGFGGESLIDAGTLADFDGDGQLESVFREERDLSFIRYVRLSAGGWRADFPDGRKLTLGTASSARVERAGQGWIARWLPELLEDGSGNQLAYTWSTAQGLEPTAVSATERYLTTIRWGCRPCATASAYQEMRFAYEHRATTAAGPVRDFGPGFLVETELYLTSITTASEGSHPGDVRTYTLGYDTSATRLLLTSVTITTADAALPPVVFAYTTASPQAAQPELLAGVPGVLFKKGVQPMDLDADGRVDVVDLSSFAGAKLYANQGASAASYTAAGAAITSPPGALPTSVAVSVVDKNRDLGTDVFDLGGAQVYLHEGATGWAAGAAVTSLPPVAMGTDTVHADVDLDGYPDLIDTSGATSWTIYFNDGTDNYTNDVVSCVTAVGGTAPTPQLGGVLHARDSGVLFGDVNGDALIDVVYVTAVGDAYVYPGRGRDCWGYRAEDGQGATAYERLTVTPSGGLPVPGSLQLVDLDGDGFDDLVEVSTPSRLDVWTFEPGTGWVPTAGPWTQLSSSTSGCRIADFDHDAIPEVLCSTGWKLYDLADSVPNLLARVDNGRGVVTTFAYTTSARLAATHRAAGAPWSTNVAAAIPVVASIEENDGRGHVLERTFDYRDPYYITDELEDRYEFVGFGHVAERRTPKLEAAGVRGSDPADAGVLLRRYYDVGRTDWFLRGTLTCEETWPGSAVPATHDCMASAGPLLAIRWEHRANIDGTWGFVTVERTSEDRYVAEGTAAPARIRTEWVHDAHGNVAQQIAYGRYRPVGRLWGNDERAEVTDWVLDTASWNLRLPARVRRGTISAAGAFLVKSIDDYAYDGNGSWQTASVGAGLLTRQRSWFKDPISGAQATHVTLRRTYTDEGLVETETDAQATITRYSYDGSLHLLRTREELDPGGLALVQELEIDSRTGAELRRVGPDGAVTEAGYDLLGRMRWLARPGDSPNAPTITRSYVDAAPLSLITDVSADGTADGLTVIRSVDGHGRVVCEEQEAGGGSRDIRQWDHSARGDVALEIAPFRATQCDAIGLAVTAGSGARTTARDHESRVVDALSRPLALAHSDGSLRTWTYDVLATIQHDEEDTAVGSAHHGTPTTHRFDGQGQLIGVDEVHLSQDDDPGTHSFAYAYDALGNLAKVTDSAARIIHTAVHDSRSRRVRTIDADLGQTDTSYDLLGRPVAITDARGVVVSMAWDRAGRVLTRSGPSGTTSYHYDAHLVPAASAACHTAGRLAWVSDASGSEVFCYDARGNTARSDKTVTRHGATALVTELAHDGLDRVTSRLGPDGTEVTYTYGEDGRLQGVTAISAGHAVSLATLTYEASGQLARAQLGNGVALERTYDARRRPTRLVAESAATTWLDLSLGYDGVGNVTNATDAVGHESAVFSYDDLYRLTSATGARFGGHTATYRYDRTGNLIRKEHTDPTSPAHLGSLTYADPAKVHAVTQAGGTSFQYDAAGHLTDDGTHTFTWNDHGLLAEVREVASGDLVYELTYDHLDRRVHQQRASGDSVVYVPLAGAELRTEAGVATWVHRVSAAGIELARIEGSFTAADVADHIVFPLTDHLGSPLVVLDAGGDLVERTSTHPWGEENTASLAAAGTLGDYVDPGDPTTTLERRFQGRERDETGDYDFGARMYRPELGRFMSPDTVVPDPASSQSWNRYSFVRNNPLRFIDPTGHTEVVASEASRSQLPPGHIGGDKAYPISAVPPDRWHHIGGRDGVQWRELEAATGNDTLGEHYLDPLLRFDSQKLKGAVTGGAVTAEIAVDLPSGTMTGGISGTGQLPFGAKGSAKCSTNGSCSASASREVGAIGPHPVSVSVNPGKDQVSISVGPQATLGPGLKAKLVLETTFTYSRETAYRYGHRLWKALTQTPSSTATTPPP